MEEGKGSINNSTEKISLNHNIPLVLYKGGGGNDPKLAMKWNPYAKLHVSASTLQTRQVDINVYNYQDEDTEKAKQKSWILSLFLWVKYKFYSVKGTVTLNYRLTLLSNTGFMKLQMDRFSFLYQPITLRASPISICNGKLEIWCKEINLLFADFNDSLPFLKTK